MLDKATNEVSLVLVKGREDVIDSLSHVQMRQELALVIKKENGFNFLESYSNVQGSDQSLQSETQLQSESEPVQAPVIQENETASEPLDAFILERYEQGETPAGISFAKMYVRNEASNVQTMVFAQGDDAVQKTKHLSESEKFTMQTRTENGFMFFEKLGDTNKGVA